MSSSRNPRGRVGQEPIAPKPVFGLDELCPYCKGTGHKIGKKEVCGACKGTRIYRKEKREGS